jgi:DNA polymerase-3 subunit delta
VIAAWFLKGDDPTLLSDEVRKIVKEQAGDDPMAVEDLSGEEVDVGQIVDACNTPPFLADRRVVVVRDVGRFTADALQPLIDWLKDPLPTTALVLTSGGGQVSQRLVNAVKKVGTVVDTSPGTGRARTSWLTDKLHHAPVKHDAAAGDLIGRHLGEDVGRLGSLLEALAAAYGEGTKLGVADVEPFLGEAGGVAPWDLTDAIDRGDTAGALSLLHRMMDAGDRHPLVVMATLHRHFAAMLRLDGAGVSTEQQAAEILGMAPFPAKKAMQQLRKIGSGGAAKAIALLADADLDLRGAQAWPDRLVMEVLVARLSRLTPSRGR